MRNPQSHYRSRTRPFVLVVFYCDNERSTRELAYADPETDGKTSRHSTFVGRNAALSPALDRLTRCRRNTGVLSWTMLPPTPDRSAARSSRESSRRLADTCCGSLAAAAAGSSKCSRQMPCAYTVPRRFWKDVGQRLLDNTCTQRTGRHEEDGCWPTFE